MSKSYVLYKDVAPLAEADATPSATGAESFSDPSLLPYGTETPESITAELNRWLLDGEHSVVDESTVGFWSEDVSGADCTLASPPVIDIAFSEQHSCLGLTLTFDEIANEWCSALNIVWYQGDTVLADVDFNPTSTTYFCKQSVIAFDRIVITLNETSLPYSRARLTHIVFGLYRRFDMAELRSAKIIHQTDLLSAELPVSTLDMLLDSDDDVEFMFQLKQPMEAWNNDNLLGVFYIDEYKRTAPSLYKIGCYNAIGILDETPFDGGYYSDASALELLATIIGADFELETSVEDVRLSGIIQSGTRREALQQVLFAAGWLCATDGGPTMRIFSTDEVLAGIGRDRVYTGVSSSVAAITTEVRVTAHTYAESANGGVEVGGVQYADTETVYTVKNPNVTANDKQSVIEVRDATLVSTSNGQAVAQRVYDYYTMRQTDSAKIVWKGERLGDYVSLPTAWNTTHAGYIQKMTITLSNTVAADVETIG